MSEPKEVYDERESLKKANTKDMLIDLLFNAEKRGKELYDDGIFYGKHNESNAINERITKECGDYPTAMEMELMGTADNSSFRKTMNLPELIQRYNKQQYQIEEELKKAEEDRITIGELKKEAKKIFDYSTQLEYQLEAYRTVLQDTHDNIKINSVVVSG